MRYTTNHIKSHRSSMTDETKQIIKEIKNCIKNGDEWKSVLEERTKEISDGVQRNKVIDSVIKYVCKLENN